MAALFQRPVVVRHTARPVSLGVAHDDQPLLVMPAHGFTLLPGWRSVGQGPDQSSRMKVTSSTTCHATTLPSLISTFCSLTQAPETFRSVLLAREMPSLMASSK